MKTLKEIWRTHWLRTDGPEDRDTARLRVTTITGGCWTFSAKELRDNLRGCMDAVHGESPEGDINELAEHALEFLREVGTEYPVAWEALDPGEYLARVAEDLAPSIAFVRMMGFGCDTVPDKSIHASIVRHALVEGRPVSAAAVESYGLLERAIDAGYIRSGDRFVWHHDSYYRPHLKL